MAKFVHVSALDADTRQWRHVFVNAEQIQYIRDMPMGAPSMTQIVMANGIVLSVDGSADCLAEYLAGDSVHPLEDWIYTNHRRIDMDGSAT
jgi:hypothetical protein